MVGWGAVVSLGAEISESCCKTVQEWEKACGIAQAKAGIVGRFVLARANTRTTPFNESKNA